MSEPIKMRIAARGLVVVKDKLLLVSNDNVYWYLPGGRIDSPETLTQCVEREVYEETGLTVRADSLLHVCESFDLKDGQHKINFYFQTELLAGTLNDHWNDADGVVQFRRFFTLEELKQSTHIYPRFLEKGEWLTRDLNLSKIYQGFVTRRGFELVEA